MTERSDWEKHKNYPPEWSWATWPERAVMVLALILSGLFALCGAAAVLVVLGMMIEAQGKRSEDHDRCMKRATNGYEIERCR